MTKTKKTAAISKQCVACGTCVKVCPRQAISIFKGAVALVDSSGCVGCEKCVKVCPAGIITIKEDIVHEE